MLMIIEIFLYSKGFNAECLETLAYSELPAV